MGRMAASRSVPAAGHPVGAASSRTLLEHYRSAQPLGSRPVCGAWVGCATGTAAGGGVEVSPGVPVDWLVCAAAPTEIISIAANAENRLWTYMPLSLKTQVPLELMISIRRARVIVTAAPSLFFRQTWRMGHSGMAVTMFSCSEGLRHASEGDLPEGFQLSWRHWP